MAEEVVAPLDAYSTAKPGEPTWTVQGGDPLGAPLLRIWAVFARLQAGTITPGAVDGIFTQLRDAANKHEPENEAERQELLLRATHTEEISWDMDSYRQGSGAVEAKTSGEKLSVDDRLDLWDIRQRGAETISGAISELNDLKIALQEKGFNDALAFANLNSIISMLKTTYNLVQFKRERHFRDA